MISNCFDVKWHGCHGPVGFVGAVHCRCCLCADSQTDALVSAMENALAAWMKDG